MSDKEKIAVDGELLEKVASYIDAANSKVEKLSTFEAEYGEFAKKAATTMADRGLIVAEDIDSVANELVSGGIAKVADAFEFVMSQTQKQAASIMGGPSSESAEIEAPSANDVFLQRLGLA